jgi:hypothetical protein
MQHSFELVIGNVVAQIPDAQFAIVRDTIGAVLRNVYMQQMYGFAYTSYYAFVECFGHTVPFQLVFQLIDEPYVQFTSTRNVAGVPRYSCTGLPSHPFKVVRIVYDARFNLTRVPTKCGMTLRAPQLAASGNAENAYTAIGTRFRVVAHQGRRCHLIGMAFVR